MMKQPVTINGITRWLATGETVPADTPETKERAVPVLRQEIGDVLRDVRQRQGRTLREVSHHARVSLGYLSEVERGQKEASSELLSSICSALNVPMALMLREVSDRIAVQEGVHIPDHIPADLEADYGRPALGTTVPDELPDDLTQLAGSH
ncbi:XRE family transcriptional regulator [Citricoccus sp. SGAir0253]|uniref:helix-turn-helix domain-containing protein n=1 Tax=Citricoccus sp. SGAir0253 TaxID=2567881 RepID=UPI0010CCBE69|nr:helix-turn-helix transcriptional regulator [Citricoccus sp. SGAir0253]QCU78499.1 XRE family transcriptional regulator [Citricoccus sp. SGAir0253]